MKKLSLLFFMGLFLHVGIKAQMTTWVNPKPTGEDFYDIHFSDTMNGWMVGSNGTIFRTFDAGQNWQALPPFTTQSLSQIVFIDATKMIFKGESSLFGSTDGGNTWFTLCDISPN